ncbi:uncharacterized protein LOC105697949 isoform X2 [Orussus abietinus]|uniref:uncharacterized protein LOC105697949 isoform X2 n=1 Tax=Orussus abietinus TaxID=222816 RepID=UPI000625F993|nr:uncharacterized protein LOC105697949 isoform X2 [Orussus abietinus]
MSRPKSEPLIGSNKSCCFCGLSEDNEVEFGRFYEYEGIITHYFCLLLSSSMEQKGSDDEGILGFLPADIKNELRRGKKLSCSYCKRVGATLGCCNSRCKRTFHFPCGLRAGSLHQFFGEFRSYCINHRPKQKIDDHVRKEVEALGKTLCYICYEEVNPHDIVGTMWAPCCKKNAWFHRKCVQQLALSAGYFFKCPLCNNKKEFQDAMKEYGIFIPSQDASWELVPNAFQELLYRHNRCDATTCLCPKGRLHTSSNAKWELTLCRLCGSQGIHMACGQLKWANPIWECLECTTIISKTSTTSSLMLNKQNSVATNENDEDSSDTDVSIGGNSPSPSETDRENVLLDAPAIKMRPGPRFFKLQQAERVAQSAQLNRQSTASSAASKQKISSEDSTVQVKTSEVKQVSRQETEVATKEQASAMISQKSIPASSPSKATDQVIMIDSDDDIIEIVDENNGIKISTEKPGTKIETRNTNQLVSHSSKLENTEIAGVKKVPRTGPVSQNILQSRVVKPTVGETLTSTIKNNTDNSTIRAESKRDRKSHDQSDVNVNNTDSVMNIKITNVTSLSPEVFASVPEQNTVNDNEAIHYPVSKSFTQAALIGTSESHAYIPLDCTAIREPTSKRKSDNAYSMDDSYCLTNVSGTEHLKKVRIDNVDANSFIHNESMTYNLNVPGSFQAIPVIVTLPYPSTSDGYGIQGNIVESQNDITSSEIILSQVQKSAQMNNLVSQYMPPMQGTNGTTSQIDSCPGTTQSVNSDCKLDSTNTKRQKTSKTFHSGQGNKSVHGYISNMCVGTVATKKMSGNTSNNNFQAHQDFRNNGLPCQIKAGCTSDKNQLTNDSVFASTNIPNNIYSLPLNGETNHGGNSTTASDGGATQPIVTGCDGDAGTGPTVEPRSGDATNIVLRSRNRRRTLSSTSSTRQSSGSSVQSAKRNHFESLAASSSRPDSSGGSMSRSDSGDRNRLIPKRVCLRDLKFQVCESDVIKMTLYDFYTVDLNVNSSDTKNTGTAESSGGTSILQREPNYFSPAFPSNHGGSHVDDSSPMDSLQLIDDLPHSSNKYHGGTSTRKQTSSTAERVDSNADLTSSFKIGSLDRGYKSFTMANDVGTNVRDESKENLDPVVTTPVGVTFDACHTLEKIGTLPSSLCDMEHYYVAMSRASNDTAPHSFNANDHVSKVMTADSLNSYVPDERDPVGPYLCNSSRINEGAISMDRFTGVSKGIGRLSEISFKNALARRMYNKLFHPANDCADYQFTGNHVTRNSWSLSDRKKDRFKFYHSFANTANVDKCNKHSGGANIAKEGIRCFIIDNVTDSGYGSPTYARPMGCQRFEEMKLFQGNCITDETKTYMKQEFEKEMKTDLRCKVSIDLNRIQTLIDTKPALFFKSNNYSSTFNVYNFKPIYKYEVDEKFSLWCKSEIKLSVVRSRSLDSLTYDRSDRRKMNRFSDILSRSMESIDYISTEDDMSLTDERNFVDGQLYDEKDTVYSNKKYRRGQKRKTR